MITLTKKKREREGQIEGRVCACVEPSHILFLQAAVCQRQGKKNKKIRTVKLQSEKKEKSEKLCEDLELYALCILVILLSGSSVPNL